MPVYVTRAHVTIGDAKKNKRRGPIVPKHVFQVSDIRHTPYCIRTFFVTFVGFIIVGGGVIMTIIGYRPGIILPWYRTTTNQTSFNNVTEPSAVPRLLGEPGPLRVLVYIGPILMGLGAFSMMVSIVLFCEIKDRYFNNIVPKTVPDQRHKDKIYDKIIEEFRKNYFRGIEVPLNPPQRRKSRGRLSISLSRSGSLVSFGRRLSHDLTKRKRERRSSRESQTERTVATKHKRSAIKRLLDTDSWMKTSSLPNIVQKEHTHDMYDANVCTCLSPTRTSRSCEPTLDQHIPIEADSGVDNPAYKESPPDKRLRRPLTKHASLETYTGNTHLTTVIIHRECNPETDCERTSGYLPELRCSSDREELHSRSPDRDCTVIDMDKDIELLPIYNETKESIPCVNNSPLTKDESVDEIDTGEVCTCGTDGFCTLHALGMDSGGSSLSLSWENIPSEWNDARRNTEPIVFYRRSFNSVPNACKSDGAGSVPQNISEISHQQLSSKENSKPSATNVQTGNESSNCLRQTRRWSSILGPFRTKISVFKSDSNLTRVGAYSLLRSYQNDNISLDSLNLTDDIMKNFEMEETAYI